MRAHASLRLGPLRGTTPELLASPWYGAWGFCVVWEAGLPHKTSSPPRNAGTAEPVRVSPPEAVAYPLELSTLPRRPHHCLATPTDSRPDLGNPEGSNTNTPSPCPKCFVTWPRNSSRKGASSHASQPMKP